MKRRTFIARLGSTAAWPVVARALQAAVPVIGMLVRFLPETAAPYLGSFRKGLRETGFFEGQHVAIDARYAQTAERLTELATDLVRHRVAVIATLESLIKTFVCHLGQVFMRRDLPCRTTC